MPMPKLPNARIDHKVPSGYWKVFITVNLDSSVNYAAFSFSQLTPRADDYCSAVHSITIEQIKQITGLYVLPTMSAKDSESIRKDLGCPPAS